jgi:hypothetical protein
MTEDRRAHIEAAIAAQEAQGLPWTNTLVYAQVRGSDRAMHRYLRDRRAQARGTALAVAVVAVVAEDEPPAPPAEPPPPPLPAPAPVAPVGALAAFRRPYHAFAQAALGRPAGSAEAPALRRCQDALAQEVAHARQGLDRARRRQPVVAYARVSVAAVATGRADAADSMESLARGTPPQAVLLRSARARRGAPCPSTQHRARGGPTGDGSGPFCHQSGRAFDERRLAIASCAGGCARM